MASMVRLPMDYVTGFLGISREEVERLDKRHELPACGRLEGEELVFDRAKFNKQVVAWLQEAG